MSQTTLNDPTGMLLRSYHGTNGAHKAFKLGLANAQALAYVLASDHSAVLRRFLEEAAKAKKGSRDGQYAMGMAGGRSTPNTVQLAIHLTGTEIELIASEPGGFTSQALGLVYREVHRVFETFLVDLFEEIARKEKRILHSSQKITHAEALRADDPAELHRVIIETRKAELTRAGFAGIEKVFDGFGLPVLPPAESRPAGEVSDVRRRLVLLGAARNIIEHNRSVVNREFLELVENSGYTLGQPLIITVTELGDALAATAWTVDNLNQRAAQKFAI